MSNTQLSVLSCLTSPSFLNNNRVVFNLKGTRYRLPVKVAYNTRVVKVLNIGTQAEYNSWKL